MAAPFDNRNAATEGGKRLDVHVSLADRNGHLRRSTMERIAQQKLGRAPTEAEVIMEARKRIYEFLDALESSLQTP